jgi:hypothetical protein
VNFIKCDRDLFIQSKLETPTLLNSFCHLSVVLLLIFYDDNCLRNFIKSFIVPPIVRQY